MMYEDPIALLAARVTALEAFKEEATLRLRQLSDRVGSMSASKDNGSGTPPTPSTVCADSPSAVSSDDAQSSDDGAGDKHEAELTESPALPASLYRQPSEALSEFSEIEEPPPQPDRLLRQQP